MTVANKKIEPILSSEALTLITNASLPLKRMSYIQYLEKFKKDQTNIWRLIDSGN